MVELLVSMAIFLMISGLLVSIANSTSKIWQQGIAHNDRRTAALAVFERMTRDLSLAAQPVDLSGARLQLLILTGASGLVSSNYTQPTAVFWQAPVTSGTNGNSGDLAAVGYFVQWVNDPGTGKNTPKLCRLCVNPSSANYKVYTGTSSSWISDAIISGPDGSPATQTSAYQGQLAENVLGLWVQALDQKMQPITKNATGTLFPTGQFDSTKGYTSTANYTSGTNTTTNLLVYPGDSSALTPVGGGNVAVPGTNLASASWGSGSLPAALEVAIVTVDSRTAQRLSGTEKPGAPAGNLWTDVNTFYNGLPLAIRSGAEIHSTIITLPAAPR